MYLDSTLSSYILGTELTLIMLVEPVMDFLFSLASFFFSFTYYRYAMAIDVISDLYSIGSTSALLTCLISLGLLYFSYGFSYCIL